MGMLGSESALDELMARILGNLIHKGIVLRTLFLGWIWEDSKLSASNNTAAWQHVIPPKVVSRVLKNCSQYLASLESLTAGKSSAEDVDWSANSILCFKMSQSHLKNCTLVRLPSLT